MEVTIEELKELLQKQAVLGEKLENILINFRAESKENLKNSDRVLMFATKAIDKIVAFRKNHEVMKKNEAKISEFNYFKERYYEEVEGDYKKLKIRVTTALRNLNIDYPALGERKNASDVDLTDVERRLSTPKGLNESENVVKLSTKLIFFEDLLTEVENYIAAGQLSKAQMAKPFLDTKYDQVTSELELACTEGNGDIDAFRSKVTIVRGRYLSLLAEMGDRDEGQYVAQYVQPLKMKPIEIEPFTGDYTTWTTFEQLFTCYVINNKQYRDIHRLQYLKMFVSDDAAKLISNLEISGENFNEAWELLRKRYSNKKAIRNMHLRLFIHQDKVMTESAFHLKELHDTSRECVTLLQTITAEQIMIHISREKLDKETITVYEQSLDDSREESLIGLLEFIERRYQVLELVHERNRCEEFFEH